MDRLLDATYRAEQTHFWFHGFRRFVRPLLERATAGVARPTILDCGCGTGANLKLMASYGKSYGFDLSWDGVEYARGSGLTRIAAGSIAAIPFASGVFDLVTAFDVLQCLPDSVEQAAAAELRRVLRPGGALIVNVAALDILRGNHAVLGGEVRRYTRRRLGTLLERHGFSIERLTYTNLSLLPLMFLIRTGQRLAGLSSPEEAQSDFRIPPAPLNAALGAVLASEAQALRLFNMPVGSSVLCLARAR